MLKRRYLFPFSQTAKSERISGNCIFAKDPVFAKDVHRDFFRKSLIFRGKNWGAVGEKERVVKKQNKKHKEREYNEEIKKDTYIR